MLTPNTERLRETTNLTICTHDGAFHYDEIFAIAFLSLIFDQFKLIRSRKEEYFLQAHILIDVGKIYDPDNNMYDHHFANHTATYSPNSKYPMASSGMIYKHFKDDVFLHHYKFDKAVVGELLYEYICNKIYYEFFRPADAADNGYYLSCDFSPRTMQCVVKNFNRADQSFEVQHKQFWNAKRFVQLDMMNYLDSIFLERLPGILRAQKTVLECKEPYVVFLEWICNKAVRDAILLHGKQHIRFIVVFHTSVYKVHVIPFKVEGKEFFRETFPVSWRGISRESLIKRTGIIDLLTVENNGYGACAFTLEAAIRLIHVTTTQNRKDKSYRKR